MTYRDSTFETDLDWISKIKSRENDALKKLYSLYRNECVDWLQKLYNVQEEIAKDAFQLAIVLLYENVINGKLKHLTSSIKSYLFAIAKNKARDLIKSEIRYSSNKKNGLLKDEILHDSQDKQQLEIILDKVHQVLVEMGDPCKTIIEMYYFHKMKLQQISIVVGHRLPSTTKSKKHKCLKRLQSLISKSQIIGID